jgi:hypothetical protein
MPRVPPVITIAVMPLIVTVAAPSQLENRWRARRNRSARIDEPEIMSGSR